MDENRRFVETIMRSDWPTAVETSEADAPQSSGPILGDIAGLALNPISERQSLRGFHRANVLLGPQRPLQAASRVVVGIVSAARPARTGAVSWFSST